LNLVFKGAKGLKTKKKNLLRGIALANNLTGYEVPVRFYYFVLSKHLTGDFLPGRWWVQMRESSKQDSLVLQ
jgi:hypothetical protein